MKISLKKLVTVILLMTAISCTKEPLSRPSAASYQRQDNATQKTAGHYIGERFGGGIIFYINPYGKHGLIADTVDLPPATWWNLSYTYTTGATGTGMRAGPVNTRNIILSQGTPGTYAALECAQSKRSGYTDWFLPSRDELFALYPMKSVVGGFAGLFYWSSSDYVSNFTAIFVDFRDGSSYAGSQGSILSVRAVRAF